MPKKTGLHLKELFELDAIEIQSARRKGQIIHRTNDINQSGISLESSVRRCLKMRLPGAYQVGHGHVVDRKLASCGQFDVIVSDAFANPFFLRTEGDSEYMPVEAVYAVGEVKSCYDKSKNPFEKFKNHLNEFHALERDRVESNFFLIGGKGRGVLMEGHTSDERPCKNPLFSFLFFAETGDFKLDHIHDLYESTDKKYLPSAVCFLDSGIIVYGQFANEEEVTTAFHYTPEVGDLYDRRERKVSRWIYHRDHGEFKSGTHFGWLYFLLASHLHYATLKPLEPMDYAKSVLGGSDYEQSIV